MKKITIIPKEVRLGVYQCTDCGLTKFQFYTGSHDWHGCPGEESGCEGDLELKEGPLSYERKKA